MRETLDAPDYMLASERRARPPQDRARAVCAGDDKRSKMALAVPEGRANGTRCRFERTGRPDSA